jgi:hypothetical protein
VAVPAHLESAIQLVCAELSLASDQEAERVPGFSQMLLDTEGSGILNWGLEGARQVLADGGKIVLSARQKGIRDAILDESESSVAFAREEVVKDARGRLLASTAYEAYVKFCVRRGWAPETPQRFWTEFKRVVVDYYGVTQATDLIGADGNVRGWRGQRRCDIFDAQRLTRSRSARVPVVRLS